MTNVSVLSGVIIRDPELKVFKNEEKTPYTFVTLLTTKGVWSTQKTLMPVRFVGNLAENICEHKKKGDRIEVNGYIDSYIDQHNRLNVFVHGNHCEFRERKKEEEPVVIEQEAEDYPYAVGPDYPEDYYDPNLDDYDDGSFLE